MNGKKILVGAILIGLLMLRPNVAYADSTYMICQTKKTVYDYFNSKIIEVSHYSEAESGNPVGYKDMGSTGKRLVYGDVAMPYEFPAWSQIILQRKDGEFLKDNKGYPIIFTNTDRGSKKCIRTYSRGINDSIMRIDLFVKGASHSQLLSIGLTYYKMYVIRIGKNNTVAAIESKKKIAEQKQKIEKLKLENLRRKELRNKYLSAKVPDFNHKITSTGFIVYHNNKVNYCDKLSVLLYRLLFINKYYEFENNMKFINNIINI